MNWHVAVSEFFGIAGRRNCLDYVVQRVREGKIEYLNTDGTISHLASNAWYGTVEKAMDAAGRANEWKARTS